MPGKQRDPAFLYYDADVALDVAHMNRTEKGCYLDLIQLYRRYHGYTMVQIRKVLGIDFEYCWNAIELVLVIDGDLYHIPWLRNSLDKKAERSAKQRENVNRRWEKAKNGDTNTIPSYSNGNSDVLPNTQFGNTIEIPIKETVTVTETKGLEDDVGGVEEEGGGKGGESPGRPPPEGPPWPEFASELPQAMVEIYMQTFPKHARQNEKDFSACLQLAYQLADYNGWPWQAALNGRMADVLAKWKEIVVWIPKDKWFRSKPLTFLNENFQGLIQAKNNFTENGNETRSPGTRSYTPNGPTNGYDPTKIAREGIGKL